MNEIKQCVSDSYVESGAYLIYDYHYGVAIYWIKCKANSDQVKADLFQGQDSLNTYINGTHHTGYFYRNISSKHRKRSM